MSKERIEYQEVSIVMRLIALILDIIVGIGIGLFGYVGIEMEYDLLWSKLNLFSRDIIPAITVIWTIVGFIGYYVIASGFTDGQTLGKLLLGFRVVTDDFQSTKRMFNLHLKRAFFMRKGTKVVKEKDPEVKGL